MKKKQCGLLSLALSSCLITQAENKEKYSGSPNVIFIYADDLGYEDLECYDAQNIHTPNVNRLAANGIRFTNGHSTAATSTPSRYSLLTSKYAWRKAGTDIAAGNAGMIISPAQFTMADLFKSAGYVTGAFGKWHLGLGDKTACQDWNAPLPAALGDLGFDYSYVMAATADRVPCVFIENGQVANYDPSTPIEVSYVKNFPGKPMGKDNPEMLYNLKSSHGHDQSIVLLNVRIPKGCAPDSYNRLATLLGQDHTDRPWVIEQAANHTISVRTKNWKYIEESEGAPMITWGPKIETGYLSTPQLYDMKQTGEQENVATKYPPKVFELKQILRKVRNKTLKLE